MNVSDSERIAGYLEGLGFKEAARRDKAALVVMTTCGVRQSAEDRAYMLLPEIKKANPKVLTVVTGCLSGRADVQIRLKAYVDLWLPIIDLPKLGKFLGRKAKAGGSLGGYLKINPKYGSTFSAFVPIGNGCDNFCAYCVVPYARGREVYRPAEEILAEVRGLVKRGYKEIALIAQNVNSYKSRTAVQETARSSRRRFAPPQDDSGTVNFSTLLKMVNAIPGDFWIRFATSHPKDMSDELITTIAGCEKVCHQVHLPVQAGDNKVLRKMNRKYTREHYLKLIKKIRQIMPDASISTDCIVGFPGETKKQFKNTERLFCQAGFDQAFIARYSPRPGTLATKMKDDVPKNEKQRRDEVLTGILKQTALANNQKYIGKTVEILVEGKKVNSFFGRTRTGKIVKIEQKSKSKPIIGDIVNVEIKNAREFGLSGWI
jgi:tRNA-2-methylthio-N6-dimethylallyladenosine synthase